MIEKSDADEKDPNVKKRVVITGYDPKFARDEYTAHKIEVILYRNGAVALADTGHGENFIYLYKSQLKELEKLLGGSKK